MKSVGKHPGAPIRKHHHGREPDMLSVDEARERVLEQFESMASVETRLANSLGLVLAEDLVSDIDIPPAPCSAMDGYAVVSSDLSAASIENGVRLPVTGSVSAGTSPGVKLARGCAMRIMTGAPIPHRANAVVPFEETEQAIKDSDSPVFRRAPNQLANVRPQGEAVKTGDTVVRKGVRLTPSHICAAAALGRSALKTIGRPVVAILSTGDELAEPGTKVEDGKIYDSNGPSIAAFVKELGGEPLFMGIVPDDLELLENRLAEVAKYDLVITTAGVSKGDYDVVADALARNGEIDLWSVRMRPGKPLAFGLLSDRNSGKKTPHLGLPGNTVSAQVAFIQFGRPAIMKMLGLRPRPLPRVTAIMDDPIINYDGRRVYARVVVYRRDGLIRAKMTRNQSSGALGSMVEANGLAICPEDTYKIESGSTATVELLHANQDHLLVFQSAV